MKTDSGVSCSVILWFISKRIFAYWLNISISNLRFYNITVNQYLDKIEVSVYYDNTNVETVEFLVFEGGKFPLKGKDLMKLLDIGIEIYFSELSQYIAKVIRDCKDIFSKDSATYKFIRVYLKVSEECV